jgi:hypothetical protein
MITNLCPYSSPNMERASPDCVAQTIPDPGLTYPGPIPLLGRAGLSVWGVNVYSPYEAGFGTTQSVPPPFPCKDLDNDMDQDGYCQGGLDVKTCEDGLHHACGAGLVETALFLDDCGGHATPYHMHKHPKCEYNPEASGHSPIISIALDGHAMYGYWEDGPSNAPVLDACNGHTGPVPANATLGVEAGEVYHYHFSPTRPFTLGCYGPVASLEACKDMYPESCNDEFVYVPTDATGGFQIYDLFCPCYTHNGGNYDGFADAMNAKGMSATNWAVQGTNDGTVQSRDKASAEGTMRVTMGPQATGSKSSDQCTGDSSINGVVMGDGKNVSSAARHLTAVRLCSSFLILLQFMS